MFDQSSEQHPNEATLRALYAEFFEEDQMLAESGMSDYSDGLALEDHEQ